MLFWVGSIACNLTIKTPSPLPTLQITPPPNISFFSDATYLLDEVCSAALLPFAGNSFILHNQTELTQFFAQLDVANVCGKTFAIPNVDFSRQIIVGAIEVVQGCDAVFTAKPLVYEQQVIQLALQFEVEAGCSYELVASFMAAIERPSEGLLVSVSVE